MKTKILQYILVLATLLLSLSWKIHNGKEIVRVTVGDSLTLSKEQLQKYCGEYLPTGNDSKMVKMGVILFNGVLYRHVNADYIALNPLGPNKFIYDDGSGRSLDFVTAKNGEVTEVMVTRPDGKFNFKKNTSALTPPAQTDVKDATEKIAQYIEKCVEYKLFNGTVLVAQNSRVFYKKAIGMANMEMGNPNQMDTKFRLASVSKQFTAMLILQMVDQGKLDLHVPITTYLPDYPKEQGQKITLHHLLTHSSGIPNFTSFDDYQTKVMRNHHTPEELVKIFSNLPLAFDPGTKFDYSNSGYILLGYIIEKVSGKSYERCLKEQIFAPLKMNNSGYDHNEVILQNRATGYDKIPSGFANASFIDMSVPFAAGALYSTAEDLYLWDQALYTDVLLKPQTKELLFRNYHEGRNGDYGYGWGVNKVTSLRTGKSYTINAHSGGINGFNTFISRVPVDKQLIILLSNTNGVPLGDMNYAIHAILHNKPYDYPKMSMASAMVNEIKSKGLKDGLAKYKEFKNSDLYVIREGEMNETGYNLMNEGMVAEAIEIFKLNVEEFPLSGNCYDSLGEAYLKHGDKELAITNYKKSIELDPKNENGKKVLEEINKK